VKSGIRQPKFRRNVALPASGSKSKSSKEKQEEPGEKPCLIIDPEEGGSNILRIFGGLLTDYTVTYQKIVFVILTALRTLNPTYSHTVRSNFEGTS
jgi:hypothetical protein